MEFVYFLGRFHVLALHLPLGILVLAVVLEVLVRFPRFRSLEPALAPTWIAGAVTAVLTVILGLMHATESGFQNSEAVDAHRTAGVLLAVFACLVALLRTRLSPAPRLTGPLGAAYAKVQPLWASGGLVDRAYGKIWAVGAAAVVVLMFATGHLGGNLTHGDTYLVQYAPTPIRRLAGISAERDPRPKPKDLASADLYLDVVAPAIRQRCDGCHNDSKSSGGFSVADHAALMKGGDEGPAIVPGDPAKSDLFRRITLPSSHEDYMPKDGKTPLTADQVAAVGAWIKAGAPKAGAVGALKLAAADQAPIGRALNLGGDDSQAAKAESGPLPLPNLPTVAAAPAQSVKELEANGFIVRKVDKASNLLSVNADFVVGRSLAAADLERLKKIAPQIYTLNLRGVGVTDSALAFVSTLPQLKALRLEENPITDAGAASLSKAKALEYVNLNGSKITDRTVEALAAHANLRRLYAWRTSVTEAAAPKAGGKLKVFTGAALPDPGVVAAQPHEGGA